MQREGWKRTGAIIALAGIVVLCGTHVAQAETSSSTNYQITEMELGAGTTQESCSGQYCTKASIGDMTTGGSASEKHTAQFGSVTPDEPLLEVIIQPGVSNLGVLTTEKTATKTVGLQIRSYLSSGYVVQLTGAPPKYGTHTLATPKDPTASTPGTEQFAINAVRNTAPAVGADPVQVPSDAMSFGRVMERYNTPNQFAYTSGEVVARSDVESGQTNYTISMIVNISNATPAGHYTGDFSAVVIPLY